jgi:hypothetical protein
LDSGAIARGKNLLNTVTSLGKNNAKFNDANTNTTYNKRENLVEKDENGHVTKFKKDAVDTGIRSVNYNENTNLKLNNVGNDDISAALHQIQVFSQQILRYIEDMYLVMKGVMGKYGNTSSAGNQKREKAAAKAQAQAQQQEQQQQTQNQQQQQAAISGTASNIEGDLKARKDKKLGNDKATESDIDFEELSLEALEEMLNTL